MKSLVMFLTLGVAFTDSSRVLAFFPMAEQSHHDVFRPIIVELAARGHQVLYVTGQPIGGELPPGMTQVDISQHIPDSNDDLYRLDMTDDSAVENIIALYEWSLIMAPFFVGNPTVQELIHSDQRFDAVLMESLYVQEYQSAFIHKFGAVGIEVICVGDYAWMNELAGVPDNPAFKVDFRMPFTQNMNFWERVQNTYLTTASTLVSYYYMTRMQEVMDRYFNYTGWGKRPTIKQLLSNKSLILTNSHPIVGYPSPLSPHRKEIGGVHILSSRPLPQDIQTFMDESDHGVIYFSLGSHINASDPRNIKIRDVFLRVFEELPQRVLMRWETEYGRKLPRNVFMEKWFPQQDVLAHKNCVLFIADGDYLSLTEAVNFGVPTVGIPFSADHHKNIHFAEEAGIGKMLRLSNLTYRTAFRTVKELISNRRYIEEIRRRSKIFKDRVVSPVDEAVYWIEYAIKYPNVLTPLGASLTFVQLHLIDVKIFLFILLMILMLIICKFLTTVLIIFKQKTKPSVKLKKNFKEE